MYIILLQEKQEIEVLEDKPIHKNSCQLAAQEVEALVVNTTMLFR